MTIDELAGLQCCCHLYAPCDLCVELDEDEISALVDGGREGLAEYIRARDAE